MQPIQLRCLDELSESQEFAKKLGALLRTLFHHDRRELGDQQTSEADDSKHCALKLQRAAERANSHADKVLTIQRKVRLPTDLTLDTESAFFWNITSMIRLEAATSEPKIPSATPG